MGFNRNVIFINCEKSKSFITGKQFNPRDWILAPTMLKKKCTLFSYLPIDLLNRVRVDPITQPPMACWKLVMTQVWTNLMLGFTLVMYPIKYGYVGR